MIEKKKLGDVYSDHNGRFWYVYGWPTSDFAFSTELDAKQAFILAKDHAREQVDALADKIRDVLT